MSRHHNRCKIWGNTIKASAIIIKVKEIKEKMSKLQEDYKYLSEEKCSWWRIRKTRREMWAKIGEIEVMQNNIWERYHYIKKTH